MKTNSTNHGDDELQESLQAWKITAPLPPRFQEQVWHRIERQQSSSTVSIWPIIKAWLRQSVVHPAYALAYATILLVLGLATGFARAQQENARVSQMIEARYVQSVDPYQKVQP